MFLKQILISDRRISFSRSLEVASGANSSMRKSSIPSIRCPSRIGSICSENLKISSFQGVPGVAWVYPVGSRGGLAQPMSKVADQRTRAIRWVFRARE